jgi:hypothetical protein
MARGGRPPLPELPQLVRTRVGVRVRIRGATVARKTFRTGGPGNPGLQRYEELLAASGLNGKREAAAFPYGRGMPTLFPNIPRLYPQVCFGARDLG